MKRCINIDWLECYCLEDSIGYPHNAEAFRHKGWEVKEREYGTPMYREMFTLIDPFGEALFEIRRAPKSDAAGGHGIFDSNSCHVRLVNRACYVDGCAKMLDDFLQANGFWFQRISRIDLCLDFERFDYGDDPQTFLERFVAGRYAKLNQANIRMFGSDMWEGRKWHSASWGSKTSCVTTRIYNKTLELAQVKDKPYIRQCWQLCGLVDDAVTMEKKRKDGSVYKPVIWRLEFVVKSGTKKWFVVEDYSSGRKRLRSIRNTLECYTTREQCFQVFLSLVQHYFHFKHVEYKTKTKGLAAEALAVHRIDPLHDLGFNVNKGTRELQRKDRCRDKLLFRTTDLQQYFQLEKAATSEPKEKGLSQLLKLLYAYRSRVIDPKVHTACNTVIAKIEDDEHLHQLTRPLSRDEVELMRRVLAIRLKDKGLTLQEVLDVQREAIYTEKQIWSNPY